MQVEDLALRICLDRPEEVWGRLGQDNALAATGGHVERAKKEAGCDSKGAEAAWNSVRGLGGAVEDGENDEQVGREFLKRGGCGGRKERAVTVGRKGTDARENGTQMRLVGVSRHYLGGGRASGEGSSTNDRHRLDGGDTTTERGQRAMGRVARRVQRCSKAGEEQGDPGSNCYQTMISCPYQLPLVLSTSPGLWHQGLLQPLNSCSLPPGAVVQAPGPCAASRLLCRRHPRLQVESHLRPATCPAIMWS
jgi:hypothetical protein